MTWWDDFWSAVEFLTRIPAPKHSYDVTAMARALKFFPLIGLIIAAAGFGIYSLIPNHVDARLRALIILSFLVLVTGGLHEDALADTADALGGRTREQALEIMRDSRIGSFGAIALTLSLLARCILLSSLPAKLFWPYLASAYVLSRWSVLPLCLLLVPARPGDGSGAKIAGKTSILSFTVGTVFASGALLAVLRLACWEPFVLTLLIVLLSAALYKRKFGGVTGDCFGATVQLVEIGVYFEGCFRT